MPHSLINTLRSTSKAAKPLLGHYTSAIRRGYTSGHSLEDISRYYISDKEGRNVATLAPGHTLLPKEVPIVIAGCIGSPVKLSVAQDVSLNENAIFREAGKFFESLGNPVVFTRYSLSAGILKALRSSPETKPTSIAIMGIYHVGKEPQLDLPELNSVDITLIGNHALRNDLEYMLNRPISQLINAPVLHEIPENYKKLLQKVLRSHGTIVFNLIPCNLNAYISQSTPQLPLFIEVNSALPLSERHKPLEAQLSILESYCREAINNNQASTSFNSIIFYDNTTPKRNAPEYTQTIMKFSERCMCPVLMLPKAELPLPLVLGKEVGYMLNPDHTLIVYNNKQQAIERNSSIALPGR